MYTSPMYLDWLSSLIVGSVITFLAIAAAGKIESLQKKLDLMGKYIQSLERRLKAVEDKK